MKKWIAGMLFLVLASSANAVESDREETIEHCRKLSGIGEGIMGMRQGGFTEKEVRNRDTSMKGVDQLIGAAFSIPVADNDEKRSEVIYQFKAGVFVLCLEYEGISP